MVLKLSFGLLCAIAAATRSSRSSARICQPIWEKCIARKNEICGAYGFPLHAGPTCLAAVQAGSCQPVPAQGRCRNWKLSCDGCSGPGYPDPEQVCTNKCQDCAQIEDYH